MPQIRDILQNFEQARHEMSATFIQVLMGNIVFLAKNIVPFRLCYFMLELIVSQVMAVRATALTF